MAEKKGAKKKKSPKKVTKTVAYTGLHRLSAGLSLLSFVVIIVAGIQAQARVITMTYRAAIVLVIIGFVTRIIVRTLASFEETKGG